MQFCSVLISFSTEIDINTEQNCMDDLENKEANANDQNYLKISLGNDGSRSA